MGSEYGFSLTRRVSEHLDGEGEAGPVSDSFFEEVQQKVFVFQPLQPTPRSPPEPITHLPPPRFCLRGLASVLALLRHSGKSGYR
ncbi:hypothetical protein BST61_g1115 [Cercospora zeina]